MNNKMLVQRSHPLVVCGALPLLLIYYSGLIYFCVLPLKITIVTCYYNRHKFFITFVAPFYIWH